MKLPESYLERMKGLLGPIEYEQFLKTFDEPRLFGLRTNTLKLAPEELCKITEFCKKSVPWCKEGFYYDGEYRPAKHPYYFAGLYYLQEPSAMSSAAALQAVPGDKVLDLCAAPGGKSTQLGAQLKGKGLLVSNDISPARTKALLKNIELFGIKNAIILSETPERLAERFPAYFDKILVDAPCSGEGMFRKEPDVMKVWNEGLAEEFANRQRTILPMAAKMLKPGGKLLYSTCTFAPEEDERMIQEFLKKEGFALCPLPESMGMSPGRPEWAKNGGEELRFCGRLWPHKHQGEGHFLALMQKQEGDSILPPPAAPLAKEKEYESFLEFQSKYLSAPLEGSFRIFGNSLYLLQPDTPDVTGLRIARNGWLLGELKKNRFEPSQALAMGLKASEFRETIDFQADQMEVIRYLKGDTLDMDMEGEGYRLVTVDGFPLGFGKLQNGRLKNKYLPGWRWN